MEDSLLYQRVYSEALVDLAGRYGELLRASLPPNRKKALLLWHRHAQHFQLSDFMSQIKEYSAIRAKLYRSPDSALRQNLLEGLAIDLWTHQMFVSTISAFTDLTESFLRVIDASLRLIEKDKGPENVSNAENFGIFSAQLQELTSEIKGELSVATSELEQLTRIMELRRGVKEFDDQRVLTNLASAFLPISLASSILSMSTRFKDLGELLFDFFAVSMVLGLVAFSIARSRRANLRARERLFDRNYHKFPRLTELGRRFKYAFYILLTIAGLVGMFSSLQFAGRVLGFGFAGIVGAYIIAGFRAFYRRFF